MTIMQTDGFGKKHSAFATLKAVVTWTGAIAAVAIGSYIGGEFQHSIWKKEFFKQEAAKRCAEKIAIFRDMSEINIRVMTMTNRNKSVAGSNMVKIGYAMHDVSSGRNVNGPELEKRIADYMKLEDELMEVSARMAGAASVALIYFDDDVYKNLMNSIINHLRAAMSNRIDESIPQRVEKIMSSDATLLEKQNAVDSIFKVASSPLLINIFGDAIAAMAPAVKKCATVEDLD